MDNYELVLCMEWNACIKESGILVCVVIVN